MPQKVFLHVGAPKSGTTYVQDRLFRNRDSLSQHGVTYPVGLRDSMFLAAVDLTGIKWPGFAEKATGEWAALVHRIGKASGTVVVSHEVFAVARPDQIAAAMADLAGYEVHLVFTARDPARQLAADWQEGLKTYNSRPFRRFLDRIVSGDPMTSQLWFWRAQHLPRSLANWAAFVPRERVHLITVPQHGPAALWDRLCAVVGIDPAWAPEETPRTNSSMGVLTALALRRINRALYRADVSAVDHRSIVVDRILPRLLEVDEERAPIRVPPELEGWTANLAEEWIAWASREGIDVVGDLDELRPASRTGLWIDPDEARPRLMVRMLTHAVVAAVQAAAERPNPDAKVTARARRAGRRLLRRG